MASGRGPSMRSARAQRHRGGHDPKLVPEHVLEPEHENSTSSESDNDVDYDDTTTPCAGGPNDMAVLPSFRRHVAYRIWQNKDKGLLTFRHHTDKLTKWKWQRNNPNNRSVLVICPWDCTSDYMEYYQRISHPFLQNPHVSDTPIR